MMHAADLPPHVQALGCLAFAGDLSMGQPVDHSPRTALLAYRLGELIFSDLRQAREAVALSLLRWAGCTGNAQGFADLFGDDIAGRAALIEHRNPFLGGPSPAGALDAFVRPLAAEHCEVARDIGLQLGLPASTAEAALDLFEHWDGSGLPASKSGEAIHPLAQVVSICGDLEVFTRVFGFARAHQLLESRAGSRHDPALVRLLLANVVDWLGSIDHGEPWPDAALLIEHAPELQAQGKDQIAELLADYADLKLPSLAQPSRKAAAIAQDLLKMAKMRPESRDIGRRAALLHGLGRVTVPNPVFSRRRGETEADREQLRLVPYWTERILSRAPILSVEAQLAGRAFERLDGSGFPRGLRGGELALDAQIIAVAVLAAEGMHGEPGGVDANPVIDERIAHEWRHGRISEELGRAALMSARGDHRRLNAITPHSPSQLTDREQDVLRHLSVGLTNKEIARVLGVSPKTAGTHVENIYRKLGVTTRAAATLRALQLSLIA
jgi:HD-GYP domain-containing protein (c-di-GMP phosphodiesterase class II)/DNA-binding CsgD family transcriptional regulator